MTKRRQFLKMSDEKHQATGFLSSCAFIVVGAEHYNTLGVVRTLGEWGAAKPYLLTYSSDKKLASSSRYVREARSIDCVDDIIGALNDIRLKTDEATPCFVITSDDKTTSYLDLHFDELTDRFIFFNAGEQGRLTQFMSKKAIGELAIECGFDVLEEWVSVNGAVPEGITYPVITKALFPTRDNWKDDAQICHTREELETALASAASSEVLVQRYLNKDNELCFEGFSVNHGEDCFLSIATTYNYRLEKSYSPYMTVSTKVDESICRRVSEMLKRIGYEGIFEVEFLLGRDGELYFGEINFRNSTWSYASTYAGMPLPVMWARSCLAGEIVVSPKEGSSEEKFLAMVEPDDYYFRVKAGKMSLAQWVGELRKVQCYYYWNGRDIMPVVAYISWKVRNKLRAVKKRLGGRGA